MSYGSTPRRLGDPDMARNRVTAALSGTNGIRGDSAPTYFTATLAW